MDPLVSLFGAVNGAMNALFGVLFAPIGWAPGWLSITVLSAFLGALSLLLFKRISNQEAIGRVKDGIDASLLAIKLFKDNGRVAVRSLASVFGGAFRLLYYSAFPMVIMIVPVSLILAQMGLWYQTRPFRIGHGEPVVLKIELNKALSEMPEVTLEPSKAIETLLGPLRVARGKEVYFKLRPRQSGYHTLVFHIGKERFEKQLAAGTGLMRASPVRPGPDFFDILLYPLEKPFSSTSPVQSIAIDYPERDSWVYGTDYWIFYFFAVSMLFAFACKPFLKVRF